MQNKFNYKNVKKIGLVSRPNSNLDTEILGLEKILKQKGVELLLFKESSKNLNLPKFELNELFRRSDFVISLGGDGTLISLCRKAYEYEKAILGIYAGKLGFLTTLSLQESANFFEEFFEGNFRLEMPFMLELMLETKEGEILRKNAFNDVVFFRKQMSSMVSIEVFRKGKIFNQYFGDGLIIATPAGSTAYNLSANGPIVYTLAEVFILTPVCSHSLTQRPIVLPRGFELEVRAKDCILCVDGQEHYEVDAFKSIEVGLSDKGVGLIHPKNRDYFQILKEKLNWGN
ncbi:NAD(+) kinase [Campylobacter helveticus]|uniref:NAD(+) kinase n=1 Tax=Campylobacter helveticus TaxID=28898 RepID=UPI0010524F45|nr:NAD(+) kinase [Campylobacter helveticus]QBL11334.1 NAD(+) kinase [Campylobacter helveticus]